MKILNVTLFLIFLLFSTISCQKEVSNDLTIEIPEVVNLSSEKINKLDGQIQTLAKDVELEIFNRWGELVYQSDDKNKLFQDLNLNWNKIEKKSNLTYKLSYHLVETGKIISKTGSLINRKKPLN